MKSFTDIEKLKRHLDGHKKHIYISEDECGVEDYLSPGYFCGEDAGHEVCHNYYIPDHYYGYARLSVGGFPNTLTDKERERELNKSVKKLIQSIMDEYGDAIALALMVSNGINIKEIMR